MLFGVRTGVVWLPLVVECNASRVAMDLVRGMASRWTILLYGKVSSNEESSQAVSAKPSDVSLRFFPLHSRLTYPSARLSWDWQDIRGSSLSVIRV